MTVFHRHISVAEHKLTHYVMHKPSVTLLIPFYGYYTGQPALAGTPKNWTISLKQSFTAHMPLMTATTAFRLGRRRQSPPQWCYL